MRSIGHCALLEEDAMRLGTEADVSAHVLDISGKKTQEYGCQRQTRGRIGL